MILSWTESIVLFVNIVESETQESLNFCDVYIRCKKSLRFWFSSLEFKITVGNENTRYSKTEFTSRWRCRITEVDVHFRIHETVDERSCVLVIFYKFRDIWTLHNTEILWKKVRLRELFTFNNEKVMWVNISCKESKEVREEQRGKVYDTIVVVIEVYQVW